MSYTAPSAVEVRLIFKALEITGSKAAEQTGSSNSRKFRRYTAEGTGRIEMPYSILFTLIAKNHGIFITTKGWKEELIAERILHSQKPLHMRD